MRSFALWLPLVLAAGTPSLGVARTEFATPADDKIVSEETITALIRQLADSSTAKRDAAAKRLIEIGAPAKVQLEAASEDENMLISRRAKVLLLSIARRERSASWDAFIAGKSAAAPPAWEKFKDAVGDAPHARKLFVDMYRAEQSMLVAYESDQAKANAILERRSLSEEAMSIPSAATCIFVAGDKGALLSEVAYEGLFKKTGFSSGSLVESTFAKAATTADPSANLLRKLAGRWLTSSRPGQSDTTVLLMLDALFNHNLEDGATLASKTLKGFDQIADRGIAVNQAAMALLILGKFGDKTHVKQIEPLLNNAEVVLPMLEGGTLDLQVRDIALVTLVHLTNQKMKDYRIQGSEKLESFKFQMSDFPMQVFSSTTNREHAFATWKKWRKANPNTPQEQEVK